MTDKKKLKTKLKQAYVKSKGDILCKWTRNRQLRNVIIPRK